MSASLRIALAAALASPIFFGGAASRASAQYGEHLRPVGQPTRAGLPADVEARLGVDEHLLAQIPLNVMLTEAVAGADGRESSRRVRFGDLLRGKPAVFSFVYHTCPSMCELAQAGVVNALNELEWSVGTDLDVITVSIDPNDPPSAAFRARVRSLEAYGRPGADRGWRYLVGERASIQELARAAGIRYFYDERTHEYAHPAVVMLLTPEGRVARYIHGLSPRPFDVRMGLLEAAQGRSVSTGEQFLMFCYRYDHNEQGYVLMAKRIMQIGGGLTALVFIGALAFLWRREIRRARTSKSSPVSPSTTPPPMTTTMMSTSAPALSAHASEVLR